MALTDEKTINETVTDKQNDIVDVDLSATAKKKFRINGDNDKILELNTSDLSIISRLNSVYPKLQKLASDAVKELDEADVESDDSIAKTSATLTKIDKKMRSLLDELFDANVSETCAPTGSMYDPFNGKLRFEYIIEVLSNLFEENLQKEIAQTSKRISKHTNKYSHKS